MKKRVIIITAVLVAVTAVIAAVYLLNRDNTPEGSLKIVNGDKEYTVTAEDLELTKVTGTMVNAKDDEKKIDAEGIRLQDLLAGSGIEGYSEVKVISSDEYSAIVTAEEAAEDGKAYIITDDGGFRLIVFGDSNAKRDVKDVRRIEVK